MAAVGANGGGKSTVVVDALIYAFWGKVRTRTMEEIITVGAPSVTVAVNFYLGDALYRVQRTTPRTGTTEGAVYVADDNEASGWRPLSERGAKETTAKVVELIGMTYEIATQTWIAEQGQYGKFATAQPRDRFALLSSVFSLDVYNERAKKAKEKQSASEAALSSVEGSISENEVVEEALAEAVITAFSALDDDALEAKLAETDSAAVKVREQIAELSIGDPRQKADEAKRSLDLIVSARNGAIDSARFALDSATESASDAESRQHKAQGAAENTATSATAAANNRFATASREAQQKLVAARDAVKQIDEIEGQLPAKKAELADHEAQAAAATTMSGEKAAESGEKKTLHAELQTEWKGLDRQITDASKRIETLRLSLDDAEHAKCFSCHQHLSPADAQALIESQGREVATWTARQAEIKIEGAAAKAASDALAREATAAAAEATNRRGQAESLRSAIARVEQMIETRPERQANVEAAQKSIEQASQALTTEIEEIEAARDASIKAADDEYTAAHAVASKALEAAHEALTKAEAPSKDEADARAELERRNAVAANAEGEVARQRAALDGALNAHLAEHRDVEAEKSRRVTVAKQQKQVEDRLVELRATRSKIDFDRKYWTVLAKAYASSGIPAMLLGGITEELNEAIDVALERISLGELSILITSTRETRGGSSENKVTVNVNTPEGPRAYESLSGGQKFRVDLAIRTGLTQVITRRTGTPIQTFILDEGWGTLDEPGIRAAVDTLTRLSADYNVLTVSHIEAVKDAFPARIKVDRSTGTSIAEVMAA
ncbi:hypothetical protein GCM10025867_47840 (plasmid) [Frondihabitans sucicola]|uniref:Nuclease SbcCD subunit C n=1 Tax=Frondihabitans sucicola TaxID=1268041 RepID=A0ABN6Y5U2_9MICO|nr:SMC family ATPase [Frondihabitans sucicola]BDZ52543.1 hypothetical protein GCM10025867_47840 [Frondihabitans sucicola]